MKNLLVAAVAVGALLIPSGAFAHEAEAEAESTAGAAADAGAIAQTGNITTIFEGQTTPDEVTIHTTPGHVAAVPNTTAECMRTQGGGVSFMDAAVTYGRGDIVKICQDLEIIRVLTGAFPNNPIVQETAFEYALVEIPGLESAYNRAVAQPRLRMGNLALQREPAVSPAGLLVQRGEAIEGPTQ